MYGESSGNGRGRSRRNPTRRGWGETTAPASSGASCLVALAPSVSADCKPNVPHSLKYIVVRMCAMLCDGRRILKIGKVVRNSGNCDEKVQKSVYIVK